MISRPLRSSSLRSLRRYYWSDFLRGEIRPKCRHFVKCPSGRVSSLACSLTPEKNFRSFLAKKLRINCTSKHSNERRKKTTFPPPIVRWFLHDTDWVNWTQEPPDDIVSDGGATMDQTVTEGDDPPCIAYPVCKIRGNAECLSKRLPNNLELTLDSRAEHWISGGDCERFHGSELAYRRYALQLVNSVGLTLPTLPMIDIFPLVVYCNIGGDL